MLPPLNNTLQTLLCCVITYERIRKNGSGSLPHV